MRVHLHLLRVLLVRVLWLGDAQGWEWGNDSRTGFGNLLSTLSHVLLWKCSGRLLMRTWKSRCIWLFMGLLHGWHGRGKAQNGQLVISLFQTGWSEHLYRSFLDVLFPDAVHDGAVELFSLTREQIERPEPFDMLLLLNWTILLFLFWQWTSWAIWWFSSWGWDTSGRAWGCPVCWRCSEMNELCAYRNLLELLKLSTSDSLTPLSSKVSDGFAVIMDTVVCCPEPAKELRCSSLN